MAHNHQKLTSKPGAHVKFYKVDNDAEQQEPQDIVAEMGTNGLLLFLLVETGEQVGSVFCAPPPRLQELDAMAAAAAVGKPAEVQL